MNPQFAQAIAQNLRVIAANAATIALLTSGVVKQLKPGVTAEEELFRLHRENDKATVRLAEWLQQPGTTQGIVNQVLVALEAKKAA